MKKNKILFIVPLPPPVHGSTVMCEYIKNSNLINEDFDCDYINLSVSRNTDEIHVFKWIKIWRFVYAYICVFFKLLSHKYSLCYVALALHKSLLKDAPFVILCKLFNRRVIIHLHGKGASKDANNFLYRWLLKVSFRNTKVILLSWLLYSDIKQFVNKENVSICPNGIPYGERPSIERKNVAPRLLFLSNLIVSKGVLDLLDALRILKDKGYNFKCDFVGGESKEINAHKFQEEVNTRQLNGFVCYHGRKYGNEKDPFFEKSDIFVFPTKEDCFPLVLIEAMANYLPIVTTNEGAIPDEVIDGENGLICEQENPQSIANCIEKLILDENMRINMGKDGYQKYHKFFTISQFELNINNILKKYMIN